MTREFDETADPDRWPDERLKLLFVCAHPAIDPNIHTPLMLQTVLGLDAVAIGRALRVAPKTIGQRLVRAKTKIRQARIAFEIPTADQIPERLEAVLNAIFAAFGTVGKTRVALTNASRNSVRRQSRSLSVRRSLTSSA